MERVFPDTNVLYPISIADLLLRLGDVALHAIVWSEDLLAEVERILIDDKGLTAAQASYFCGCIREAFPDGEICRPDYEHLIATMTGRTQMTTPMRLRPGWQQPVPGQPGRP